MDCLIDHVIYDALHPLGNRVNSARMSVSTAVLNSLSCSSFMVPSPACALRALKECARTTPFPIDARDASHCDPASSSQTL